MSGRATGGRELQKDAYRSCYMIIDHYSCLLLRFALVTVALSCLELAAQMKNPPRIYQARSIPRALPAHFDNGYPLRAGGCMQHGP